MKRPLILLDMDEVLADFVGGACTFYGSSYQSVLPYWEEGKWDLVPPLNAALRAAGREFAGPDGAEAPALTEEAFWRGLDEREDFWLGLAEKPWFHQLIRETRAKTDEWFIVTSPSYCPACYSGKFKWLAERLGAKEARTRLIPTPAKYLFARRGAVLVDDSDANCRRFVLDPDGKPTGGHAVTFPTHHNHMSKYRDDPFPFVSAALDSFARNL